MVAVKPVRTFVKCCQCDSRGMISENERMTIILSEVLC